MTVHENCNKSASGTGKTCQARCDTRNLLKLCEPSGTSHCTRAALIGCKEAHVCSTKIRIFGTEFLKCEPYMGPPGPA